MDKKGMHIWFVIMVIFVSISGIFSVKYFLNLSTNKSDYFMFLGFGIFLQIYPHLSLSAKNVFITNNKNWYSVILKYFFIIAYIISIIISIYGSIMFFGSKLDNASQKEIKNTYSNNLLKREYNRIEESLKENVKQKNIYMTNLNNIYQKKDNIQIEINLINDKYNKLIKEKEDIYNKEIKIKESIYHLTSKDGVVDLENKKANDIEVLRNKCQEEIKSLNIDLNNDIKEKEKNIKNIDEIITKKEKEKSKIYKAILKDGNKVKTQNNKNIYFYIIIIIIWDLFAAALNFSLFFINKYKISNFFLFMFSIFRKKHSTKTNVCKSIIKSDVEIAKTPQIIKEINENQTIFSLDEYLKSRTPIICTLKDIVLDINTRYNININSRQLGKELKLKNIQPLPKKKDGYSLYLI